MFLRLFGDAGRCRFEVGGESPVCRATAKLTVPTVPYALTV